MDSGGRERRVVIGGSGAGKSNLVGFITTRTDILCQHLPGEPDDYCLYPYGCKQPADGKHAFYRSMLWVYRMQPGRLTASLAQEIQQATGMLISLEDTLGLHFVLQQAHEILVNGGGKHVVWLIDRFDEACVKLEATTLNSLRNLRWSATKGATLLRRVYAASCCLRDSARVRVSRNYGAEHVLWGQ